MEDLLQKWMKEHTTVEQVLEAVVLEQLFNTLAPDVRLWVKERQPKTAKEAAELADQITQARKQDQDWRERRKGEAGLE